jgi:hypothetical protein
MKGGESNEETDYSIYRYSVCAFYDRPLLRSGSGSRTCTRKEDDGREEGREERKEEDQEGKEEDQEGKEGREEDGREEDGRKEITCFNLVFVRIYSKGVLRNHEPLLIFGIKPVLSPVNRNLVR